ncbi:MAG: hypothetical protein Q9M19_09045 [Mariprofundaceae bacterium]|nr:hypothetical protein [Mariprofundaceae bacterium]
MMRRFLVMSLFMLLFLGFGRIAAADNVAMVETMKFLAPATVNLLIQRANNGGPYGFQVGDEITYLIKYKPVPNGGNTGANGYITDYMPNGLQVIDAGFMQPDGFGGYYEVPPLPGGDMPNHPDGNGNRLEPVIPAFIGLPATPINLLAYENDGASANGAVGNLDANGIVTSQGTLAQVNGDTGVWFSTDLRTAFSVLGVAVSRNAWDRDQIEYENTCANNNGGAEGPWGSGSPVAGPQTFYQHEVNWLGGAPCAVGPVGPWQRIGVSGSRISDYGLMEDTQASRELFSGDPLYGRDLASNPLPVVSATTPVTIRWANGLNSVGEIKYVFVTARIVALPAGGTIINNSEVWGGDVYYAEGGKDNAWKYNDTLVSVGNNSDMVIVKTPNVEAAQVGDVVSFQITVINTGARAHTGVVITDYLNTYHQAGPGNPFEVMAQYNCDASGAGIYGTATAAVLTPAACPIVGPTPGDDTVAGAEAVQWTLALLNPGASQTFTYSVTALTPPSAKDTSAADHVVATSIEMPAPGATAGASFEIGVFPLLTQTKIATPTSILPGGTTRYHIRITNTGAGSAGVYRDVLSIPSVLYTDPIDLTGKILTTIIKDTLPTGFSYAGNPVLTLNGAPVLGATLLALGQDLTWNIPHTALQPNELGENSVLDVYFDAQASPTLAAGVYKNSVYTSIPYNKKPKAQAPANKDWSLKPLWSIDTAPVTVGTVQMALTALPSTVENTITGTSTVYTVTVTNNGAAAVTAVAITHVLPAGFSYQNASTAGTGGITANPTVTGQSVTWVGFDVPANSSRTLTYTADIASNTLPAAYFSDMTATASNASLPSLTHTTPVVVTSPGLAMNKSVDKSSIVWRGAGIIVAPFPTEVVTYTITATNSGTASSIIDVLDVLPAGFEYDPTVLANVEVVTLNVAGVSSILTRSLLASATTYTTYPTLLTATPSWGTFTIPPKSGVNNSVLSITFPVNAVMASGAAAGTNVIAAPGTYNNTLTVAGNVSLPSFVGAPVSVASPVSKWTNTPTAAINGLIDYRLQVSNQDIYAWSAVSVVDYLGTLSTAGVAALTPSGITYGVANAAYYAIGLTAPTGIPGTDPLWLLTTPTVAAQELTFDNAAVGFTIPAGENLFIAYTATAPAAVPAPPTLHNSVQTLNYTANAVAHIVNTVWDGALAANAAENVTITATPTINLAGTKSVLPASLYLYGAAAPSALTYSIRLSNNNTLTASSGTITVVDTLAAGITADPAVETVFVDHYTAAGLFLTTTNITATSVWNVALNQLTMTVPNTVLLAPAGGYINIRFTASVAALTVSNSYFNSASWTGTNVNAGNVGPTAAVSIDPVTVSKQALTSATVSGGLAKYRITVTNAGNVALTALSITDYFGDVLVPTPSGFTFNSDAVLSVNGTTLLAGTDYTAPLANSISPVWSAITLPAATAGASANLVIDFYANVPAAQPAGIYNNSVSSLVFTPTGGLTITSTNPFDGGFAATTADDVTVASVGITKSVVAPYASVSNNVLLGTLTKYLITVSNSSAAAQLVNVQDTLPAGFTVGAAYVATGLTQPVAAPPAVGWTLLTPTIIAPQSTAIPLFENGGAGHNVPANSNLFIYFTANIANTVAPASYNNQANVRLTAAPNTVVGSVSGATVAVTAPQPFLSKVTSTANLGKDIYGEYAKAHYKVTVTNVGSEATGVVIVDTLPLNFNLYGQPTVNINGTDLLSTAFSCTQLLQVLTCDSNPAGGFTVPAASGGTNGLITLEYDTSILNTVLAGAYTNLVHANTTNAGRLPLLVANDPFATVTLHDVSISKSTSTASLSPGDIATYTITVSNFSAAPVGTVKVTEFLPSGFTYIAGSTTGTGWIAAEPATITGLPVWTIASVAANSSATITFNVQVALTVSGGTTYYNSILATHLAGAITVNFPNIGPTAPVAVLSAVPSLTVVKSADVSSAAPGAVITYKVHIKNTGSGQASTVFAVDDLSVYTQLGLDAWGVNLPVKLTDGPVLLPVLGASGLALGTVDFSTDGGTSYTTLDALTRATLTVDVYGYAAEITDFKVNLTGTMNSNTTTNPAFMLEYKAQVK